MVTRAALYAVVVMSLSARAYGAAGEAFPGLTESRELLKALREAPRPCNAPGLGPDLPGPEVCEVQTEFSFGASAVLASHAAAPAATSLNQGFQGFGAAGQEGSVDGPGRTGNGRYKVLQNDADAVALSMRTGYMEIDVYLRRDASGNDTLRVNGRKLNVTKGGWGPVTDVTFQARFTYDTGEDSGQISYLKDGKWTTEAYWGGRSGTSMNIEFGGGWDHGFKRD